MNKYKDPLALGMPTWFSLIESLQRSNQVNANFPGISSMTETIRKMSIPSKNIGMASVLTNSLEAKLAYLQTPKKSYAFSKLTSSLMQIATQNYTISGMLANVAVSQVSALDSIIKLTQAAQQPYLQTFKTFNTLGVVLQGASSAYLKDISKMKSWDEIEIVQEVNQTISAVVEETFLDESTADIEIFAYSLLKRLSNLLSQCKTEKARKFISYLITTFSIILSLYGIYLNKSDNTNQEVIAVVNSQFEKLNTEYTSAIQQELEKFSIQRVAQTNVNLRKSPHKNSAVIGLVNEGQIVTVLEIQHKYLLIAYLDKNTGEPQSGFVVKKYFKNLYY